MCVHDDGAGGKALELKPREKLFVNALLRPDAFVPIGERSLLVLHWTARAPDGGCPLSMRIDYFESRAIVKEWEALLKAAKQ